MKIEIIKSVDDADKAQGLTVIIDVFRAFSVEAYLFANGAEKIIPVQSLDEAHALKKENPSFILMGERKGLKVEGFDYGNSPTEILNIDFTGKTIIHTTSNGTKGLVNAVNADIVLAGSFLIADSIIKYIKQYNIGIVSLVSTSPHIVMHNEDIILATYIKETLEGKVMSTSEIKEMSKKTSAYQYLFDEIGVPSTDFDLCLDFNKFNFIIKKIIKDGQLCLIKENNL